MDKKKPFFSKYSTLITIILTLAFIYLFVVLNQKINFFLGNELIVYLNPGHKSFSMQYNDTARIDFEISVDNVASCSARCSYSFFDRSADKLIENSTFGISKGESMAKSFELSPPRKGSGQVIYSFESECYSIPSLICLTSSPRKFRSSLITVNYDLSAEEKNLKTILMQNLTALLESLDETDVMLQRLDQRYDRLGSEANLLNLSSAKSRINEEYGAFLLSVNQLRDLWNEEDYFKLDEAFKTDFFGRLDGIRGLILAIDSEINRTVEKHNALLLELSALSGDLNNLRMINLTGDSALSGEFQDAVKTFSSISDSVLNNSFGDYDSLGKNVRSIKNSTIVLAEKSRIPAASLFFESEHSLKLGKDFLCGMKKECTENITINDAIKNTEDFFNYYPSPEYFENNCNLLKQLNKLYTTAKNETLKTISDKGLAFPSDEGFLEAADIFRENEMRKINNSYHESFKKIRLENKTNADILETAEALLPKNSTDILQINYNQSANFSLYFLSRIGLHEKALEMLQRCSALDKFKPLNFTFENVNAEVPYNIVSRINQSVPGNPSICCMFGKCAGCCSEDSCDEPAYYPVILLHGHSFVKDNSPEFSLDSFNKLQSKLQEDGYLNTGIISLQAKNEPLQKGIWGMSPTPITVRASYYYDAFRSEGSYIVVPTKSENIDTYAIRLKDIIDIVKQRTNKPKVSIITHSMGGLVARRYMQIFGDNDVHKLVMIAAPNKGISGAASDYCGIVGENRECIDMDEDSLFINKLNDPSRQPDDAMLFNLVGTGCSMNLQDGDGVVLAENAKLDNAKNYFINGTCTGLFGKRLHTEILNIDTYPEVYETVRQILEE